RQIMHKLLPTLEISTLSHVTGGHVTSSQGTSSQGTSSQGTSSQGSEELEPCSTFVPNFVAKFGPSWQRTVELWCGATEGLGRPAAARGTAGQNNPPPPAA